MLHEILYIVAGDCQAIGYLIYDEEIHCIALSQMKHIVVQSMIST